ncbi:hypothetical protein Taro_030516 [Colocasia esculenta]|uniref:Thaumatin-like protein n=1 Tax=Colocasia esculenta TaxID=4460 RepID=A0A843VGJ1_COLES|nr:hypothetical protein [Colocasia esculenta]
MPSTIMAASSHLFLLFAVVGLCVPTSLSCGSTRIVIVNNCNESVWPAVLGVAGHPTPMHGGFHLGAAEAASFEAPCGWSGRVWGRRGCCFDKAGRGSCETGDCDGLLRCRGAGGAPPATVVEMTLGTARSPLHYYDVSLVDGFNLPVSVVPVGVPRGGAAAACGAAACEVDLNACCPSRFEAKGRDGRVAGCKSACMALGTDKYCCRGEYGSPARCRATLFSILFKAVCPRASTFAYDEASSLHTCMASRYLITFCPPRR